MSVRLMVIFSVIWFVDMLTGSSIAMAQVVDVNSAMARHEDVGLLPSWMVDLFGQMPHNVVVWVLAIFALLNGISIGLDKISQLTASKADDKITAVLDKVVNALKQVVNLFIAKS